MLSATPIPRTLAMSYLADIDVSHDSVLVFRRHLAVQKLNLELRENLFDFFTCLSGY